MNGKNENSKKADFSNFFVKKKRFFVFCFWNPKGYEDFYFEKNSKKWKKTNPATTFLQMFLDFLFLQKKTKKHKKQIFLCHVSIEGLKKWKKVMGEWCQNGTLNFFFEDLVSKKRSTSGKNAKKHDFSRRVIS